MQATAGSLRKQRRGNGRGLRFPSSGSDLIKVKANWKVTSMLVTVKEARHNPHAHREHVRGNERLKCQRRACRSHRKSTTVAWRGRYFVRLDLSCPAYVFPPSHF